MVAVHPQLRHMGMRRPADAGNGAMAQFQQVQGGQVAALLVVDAHQIGRHLVQAAVDDDHRRAHRRQHIGQRGIATDGREHDAVDALFQQHTQVVALLLRIVVGVAQDHAVAIALAAVLDTPRQFGKIRVDAVGHQQADGRRAARLQRAGHGAGHVVEFGDRRLDLAPHVRADRAAVVHHMGNRGVGNPRPRRHILDGRHASSACARVDCGRCPGPRR